MQIWHMRACTFRLVSPTLGGAIVYTIALTPGPAQLGLAGTMDKLAGGGAMNLQTFTHAINWTRPERVPQALRRAKKIEQAVEYVFQHMFEAELGLVPLAPR